MTTLAQALTDAGALAANSVMQGHVLQECAAAALLGAEKLAVAASEVKTSDSRAALPTEHALLALRFALLRVSDVSEAILAFDTANGVTARISSALASALATATASLSDARARMRSVPSVSDLLSGGAAPDSPAPTLSNRSSRNLSAAFESMQAVRGALVAAAQRGSEQAGSALSSVGGSGIADAISYATEELGRALAAARSSSILGVAGALPGAAAAAESLSLARGALQALSHRLGSLAGVGSAAPAAQAGAPQAAALPASWGASGALSALQEAVTQAAAAVSRAATDASGAVSRATAATSSDAVAAGSRAALSAALLSLADRGVSLAVSSAAHFDRQHHIVERLQTLSEGYGVTERVALAANVAQSMTSGLDSRLGLTSKAQAILGRAAALDAAVAGGRGSALAETAAALGSSFASQGSTYARGVVAEFNAQRTGRLSPGSPGEAAASEGGVADEAEGAAEAAASGGVADEAEGAAEAAAVAESPEPGLVPLVLAIAVPVGADAPEAQA